MTTTPPEAAAPRRAGGNVMLRRLADRLTVGAATGGAVLMIGLLLLLFGVIAYGAWPAVKAFGFGFIVDTRWNPNGEEPKFGAWPVIYGTLVSSLIALVISVPVSVGSAVFLVRLCPRWLVKPASFLIELLAAIPSIAYGLWGAATLVPFLQDCVNPFLERSLGWVPGGMFASAGSGYSLLAAGIILSIMVTPIITAVTRDVLRTVPPELEQGAYGLGATWWQATKVVLSFAKMGIFGAVILGLARALGETMAVTMVIGNTISKDRSLLAPGQTIASLLANQFREADTEMFSAALIYAALLLLVITVAINGIARVFIVRVAARGRAR